MQDYYCVVKSNYFHVKDVEKFKEVIRKTEGYEHDLNVWEQTDEKGLPIFGFGVYGGILGIKNSPEDDYDSANQNFIEALQQCVTEDDAIIILEVISSQIKYVIGDAMIITSSDYRGLDLTNIAIETAAQMLNNPDWDTECDY